MGMHVRDRSTSFFSPRGNISTLFISCSGVDVSNDEGANTAQELMASVQRICYANDARHWIHIFLVWNVGTNFVHQCNGDWEGERISVGLDLATRTRVESQRSRLQMTAIGSS